MNKEVSFKLALLLDEKKFGEYNLTEYHYNREDYYRQGKLCIEKGHLLHNEDYPYNVYNGQLNAPTIAEVVMWLYEKYGIWIAVNRVVIGSDEWDYGYIISYLPKEYEFEKRRSKHLVEIQSFKEGVGSYHGAWHTPTEAYEAAIKYTLENLIQGGNK